jgi:predicted dehydrogenase
MRTTLGLIGLGYWGKNLCRVLAQNPHVDLRWICDPDEAGLKMARSIAPTAFQTSDPGELLADSNLTGVVIATPVDTHYPLALAALQGSKHVLVEKPLSRTEQEAQDLCSEADRSGMTLMVGHTFLYNGAVRKIKAMIDSDELGDIHYIFSRRLNLGIVRQDVDALWSLAPHDLAILNYWLDRPVERASATGDAFLQDGIADVVFAHLTYAGNIAGHVLVSWLDPIKVRQITIVGTRKMLVFDDVSTDARIVVYDKGIDRTSLDENLGSSDSYAQHQLKLRAGDAWLPRVEFREPLVVQIDEFVDCIVHGRQPLTDGHSGLAVVSLLERLSKSMAKGKNSGS